jgi:hypothetical protein
MYDMVWYRSRSVYPLTVFIFFVWKLLCPFAPASHWASRRVLLRTYGALFRHTTYIHTYIHGSVPIIA